MTQPRTPREVVAYWLWTEADAMDFDDMGVQAGSQVIAALDRAGFAIVPKEPTEAMLEAALDISGQRIAPYEAPRESGVPVECDMSAADAAELNDAFKAAHADNYVAMIAAYGEQERTEKPERTC